MTDAERAFYKLLADLSSDGLFAGRPGTAERIIDAFEQAIEATKNAAPRKGAARKDHSTG